ncbi:MAG: Gfo/Idh/MocA family oxidoreductase [Planctomycetia bacterium]|nr:Gfo/Idh/MocA family oxidoreductase [Planctomycetia bacterium]
MSSLSRRSFMQRAAVSTVGLGLTASVKFPAPGLARELNANSKVNLAHVGLAGMQGAYHRSSCADENRVAICDVDSAYLDKFGEEMPDAKRFVDFREMYDTLGDKIDAVLITTPDHTHAIAAIEAMKRGYHAYVEKPLAHDVYQIRLMQKMAREKKLVTQMGTQIHAGDNYRRVVELVRSGVIGTIQRIDVWCGVVWGGSPRTNDDSQQVPATLNWDLWLGPAPERKFQQCYLGGNWRSFWDFGNGGMGDMGCHFMDLPFWALDLQYPKKISASAPKPADEDYAARDLHVEYEFSGVKNAVDNLVVTWSDGVARPESLKDYGIENGNGVLFIGDKGAIYSNYSEHQLYVDGKPSEIQRPEQTIPASIGHHKEWFEAIKTGTPTTCNFDYSGRVAETILLGPVAYRCGKTLEYDAENMAVVNCPEAAKLLKQDARKGWEV